MICCENVVDITLLEENNKWNKWKKANYLCYD